MTIRVIAFLLVTGLVFSQCKSTDGPQMTPSGYEYKKINSTGGVTAQPGQYVFFEMNILDDKGGVLQAMRGAEPQAAQIPGEGSVQAPNPIVDVLGAIAVGDTAHLTIPIDSMPGANAVIKQNAFITYDLNVLEIVDKTEYDARIAKQREEAQAQALLTQGRATEIAGQLSETLSQYKSGSLKGLKKTASGLEYVIHEKGSGALPVKGEKVVAHYYGVTKKDGTMFDNSYKRGKTFDFNLGQGQVIKGWDEGMALMPKGSAATFFIPYALAYGEAGRPPSIPAKSDLVFFIELME